MLNLATYRHRNLRLADFLPWAALVAKGIVLNKDGSFQRSARFRRPDLDSATPAELVAITGRLNNALRRLGSCWAIFIEAQRQPAHRYPDGGFRDPVSALVDAERRARDRAEILVARSVVVLPDRQPALHKPADSMNGGGRAVG